MRARVPTTVHDSNITILRVYYYYDAGNKKRKIITITGRGISAVYVYNIYTIIRSYAYYFIHGISLGRIL